jgi:hypothetical protein
MCLSMYRKRLLRTLLVALTLASLAGAGQARFCAAVEHCAMAGAEDQAAPSCMPEMGGDCCAEGEAPSGTPSRGEATYTSPSPLLSTAATPVAPRLGPAPPAHPDHGTPPAGPSASVPLYTLLATLLI